MRACSFFVLFLVVVVHLLQLAVDLPLRLVEFVEKYFKKGMKIALVGRLEQERWEKDGKKNSRVVINAERVEFGESKAKPSEESKEKNPGGFMPMTDEELPFN